MTKVIAHPSTLAQLDHMLSDFPQAVILQGKQGVGLSGLAEYISQKLNATMTKVLPEKNEKVDVQQGVISVSSIRRLYEQTRTAPKGSRLVVIDYAERMGVQAQNAFLKLLEEPGKGTHFLLLSHGIGSLLPTVISRSQTLEVRPITKGQSEALLDALGVKDATKRTQLLFVASGLPAQLQRLVADEDLFLERAALIRDARTLIQGSAYDKLSVAQFYKDDREAALTLLTDAMSMLRVSLEASPKAQSVGTLGSLLEAYEAILANGNLRLQLAAHVV